MSTNNALTQNLGLHGILTISINVLNESMNILNKDIIDEFASLLPEIQSNDTIKAVVLVSGKPDSFIAGADINMLQDIETAQQGTAIVQQAHHVLLNISTSTKPFVAAIHGACLGAGYELALACHYRIASDHRTTKVGLPEVMLGLLPGATGTTKLPRLIGLPAALDLLLSGKQLHSHRALRIGMLDEVVPNVIINKAATQKAISLITTPYRRKKTIKHTSQLPVIGHLIVQQARKRVLQKTRGLYPAPLAILEIVRFGLTHSLKETLAYEAKTFGELTVSPQVKQLIPLYFSSMELKKASYGNGEKVEKRDSCRPTTIGIIGGGLMGAGIALCTIEKTNASVRINDIHTKGLQYVHDYIARYYKKRSKKYTTNNEQVKKTLHQLTSTNNYQGFSSCDIIIEAVCEDITVKRNILKEVENLGNKDIIFASNTSSIPISHIVEKAERPENVIGMHYFSPVEKMPLLEVVKHKKTSTQTIVRAVELGRQQGKTVIIVNDGAGFYVNRILSPYINAALQLGLDGVSFEKIDSALKNFGFPIGPIKLLDEIGIDIACKIAPALEGAFGERMKSCGIQNALLAKNRLGKKVQKGFYCYNNTNHTRIDESIYNDLNITQKNNMKEHDIVQRCLYPMLAEALLCLEENIIRSPRDGDLGAIFGIGFPPFLGGPFRYMESIGIDKIILSLEKIEANTPAQYPISNIFIAFNNTKTRFY